MKALIPGGKANPSPLPVIVDGEEHYEVEKVLNSHFICNHLHFPVKWEGMATKRIHGSQKKISQPQLNCKSFI